jgi:hypothetical protein
MISNKFGLNLETVFSYTYNQALTIFQIAKSKVSLIELSVENAFLLAKILSVYQVGYVLKMISLLLIEKHFANWHLAHIV